MATHFGVARQLLRPTFGLLALMAALAADARAQWTVTQLHPAGAASSRATAATSAQQTGFAMVGGLYQHAGTWAGSAASWVDLMPAGNFESRGLAASGGQQAGWASGSPTPYAHAGLWSGNAASWIDLHPNTWPPFVQSLVIGASGGVQVGSAYPLGGVGDWRASLWTGSAASWTSLHPALASWSYAEGVDGGQQVGWAKVSNVMQASLWTGTAASWTSLNPAGALHSHALAVHGGRQVGYAQIGSSHHASLWSGSAATWVDLQPAGASASEASAVHAGRQAGFAVFAGAEHAGLWSSSADSWVDLHAFVPAGFVESRAFGVFSDGVTTWVVGSGDNSAPVREEALLWTLPSAVVTYCTAKTTSIGCVPAIGHVGASSASQASGFRVRASSVINNKPGLLLHGVNGRASVSFLGGRLCVAGPVRRSTAANSGGHPPPNDCSGLFELDMNAFAAGAYGGGPLPALRVPGTVVDCQWWGRDPGFAPPFDAQLSDALEYAVAP